MKLSNTEQKVLRDLYQVLNQDGPCCLVNVAARERLALFKERLDAWQADPFNDRVAVCRMAIGSLIKLLEEYRSVSETAFPRLVLETRFFELAQDERNLKECIDCVPADLVEDINWMTNILAAIRYHVLESRLVSEDFLEPGENVSIVCWPDSQELMAHPDWGNEEVFRLINCNYGLGLYGSSAFFVFGDFNEIVSY